MSAAVTSSLEHQPIAPARVHAVFRFSTGIMVAFVISEAMGWSPTFLAPVLYAVLVTSLPVMPPFKVGLGLVLVMTVAAVIPFLLSTLLRGSPHILVGAIAVAIFLALTAIAHGRGKLPATFLLICLSTIPVIAMIAPAQAGVMPVAMVRSTAVAIVVLWCTYAAWPQVAQRPLPPPAMPTDSPVRTALIGTAIIMPVMLVYLLFGLADALPVLVTVVMLVTTFDPRQGSKQALGMMLGNLVGGLIGLAAFFMVGMAPSLATLALITFLVGTAFAIRIDTGGPIAAIALLTCNSSLIIFSTALANPDSSSGVWITRLFQFALACLFAIAVMTLVWRGKTDQQARGAEG